MSICSHRTRCLADCAQRAVLAYGSKSYCFSFLVGGVGVAGGVVEFVPVDAVAHARDVVVAVSFLVLFMQLVEEPVWVGVLAFHVAQPFAGEHAVAVAQAPVVDEHAFDGRVDAALEAVARPLRWPSARVPQVGVEEREERAVPPQPFEPPVAAAQWLVGPPPVFCQVGVLVLVM